MINVTKATISRLPGYLRYLRDRLEAGNEYISSTVIADDMRLNPVQVRKDLAVVSSLAGKPKKGFCIKELILDIERFLGYNNSSDAVLVGVGRLGHTLLCYEGFTNYGLNIVAGFDSNPEIIGTTFNGKPIFDVADLKKTVKRLKINIGIITVQKQYAQKVADDMIDAGIKAIWNFAPTHLKIPDGIAYKSEDMAASLAILSDKLTKILRGN